MEKDLMKRARQTGFASALLAALIVCCASQAAATLIAPHALFVDHRVRSAAIFLHNPDDKPVEIGIELIYGYPRPDGQGGVRVFLESDPAEGEPSCAEWIRALPRRLILLPGQRQTVRLMAQPPKGLPDGEYWSRVVVSSQAVASEVDAQEIEGTNGVRVGLKMATRTIISLNYRKGPVSTALDIGKVQAQLGRDAIAVSMELKRFGDAAWLGQVDVVLLDSEGEELLRWDQVLAVYEDQVRTLALPLKRPLEPGSYLLSITCSTSRGDLPPENLLAAATVVRAVPIISMTPPGR